MQKKLSIVFRQSVKKHLMEFELHIKLLIKLHVRRVHE